ncbi:MAG: NAD(P)-dependent oxidoreductase, partial [Limisphaerales bacterium]
MDILISEDLESPAIQNLGEKYQLLRGAELWKDPAKLKEAIHNVRAILIRNQTQLTADILAEANQLLAIGRAGVGLDNIDIEEATERGIVVISPLNANVTSVAEMTLGLMISLARNIPQANNSTKKGEWDRSGFTGIELERKVLAICGFGRIGRLVAKRARA